MNIAIVGGGIMGASTALALVSRGYEVTLFDALPPGHNRGSSHGRSRIVRRAYPDAFYTQIMTEAYPMWAELERRSGEKLIDECGLLYFGPRDGKMLNDAAEAMTQIGVEFEMHDSRSVSAVPDAPTLLDGEWALYIREAGWVAADRALAATQRLFLEAGGIWRTEKITSLDQLSGHDQFVLACGPWISDFVPVDATVTQQTFAYISGEKAHRGGPVWIHECEELFYGFPTEPGRDDFKIGIHIPGPAYDPDQTERILDPAWVGAIARQAESRFGVVNPVVQAETCLYTTTPDEDFRIGRVDDGGYFISACSGHGFKLGPWMGKLMADCVEGRQNPEDWPRFCR